MFNFQTKTNCYIVVLLFTGLWRNAIQLRTVEWIKLMLEMAKNPPPVAPPLKLFKPKCPELQELKSYHFGAPASYWDDFPVHRNLHSQSPYSLDSQLLLAMSIKVGVRDLHTVRWVCKNIEEGCDLKVDATNCKPTRSPNAPSARKEGLRVMDAIGQWVKDKIVAGPFDSAPNNAFINGIMTKAKPTGAVRIIINQNSPKGRSINDNHLEEYPVSMYGIREFVFALNFCGRKAIIWKADWNNAYKVYIRFLDKNQSGFGLIPLMEF